MEILDSKVPRFTCIRAWEKEHINKSLQVPCRNHACTYVCERVCVCVYLFASPRAVIFGSYSHQVSCRYTVWKYGAELLPHLFTGIFMQHADFESNWTWANRSHTTDGRLILEVIMQSSSALCVYLLATSSDDAFASAVYSAAMPLNSPMQRYRQYIQHTHKPRTQTRTPKTHRKHNTHVQTNTRTQTHTHIHPRKYEHAHTNLFLFIWYCQSVVLHTCSGHMHTSKKNIYNRHIYTHKILRTLETYIPTHIIMWHRSWHQPHSGMTSRSRWMFERSSESKRLMNKCVAACIDV